MVDNKFYTIKVNVSIDACISLDENFVSQIDDHDVKFLPVNITVQNDDDTVAILEVIIIDKLIYDAPEYMFRLGDDIDAELRDVLEDFIDSAPFKKLHKDGYSNIAYISRLFVMPKYRQQGLGMYLLKNLESVLEETIGFNIDCFLTFICPLDYDGKAWMRNGDKEMRKIMKNLFKSNGFKNIKGSGDLIKVLY